MQMHRDAGMLLVYISATSAILHGSCVYGNHNETFIGDISMLPDTVPMGTDIHGSFKECGYKVLKYDNTTIQ